MKEERMLLCKGLYACTQCRAAAILPVEDDTPFKCTQCSAEECELDFPLTMGQSQSSLFRVKLYTDTFNQRKKRVAALPLREREERENVMQLRKERAAHKKTVSKCSNVDIVMGGASVARK
jgi:hypothetical protein